MNKAKKRKWDQEKKPRRADKKLTLKEFKMLVKDVLETDLHRYYEGKIKDVYDIITLLSVQSEYIDLKGTPSLQRTRKRSK